MHVIYDIAKTGSIRTVHSVVLDNTIALVDVLESTLLTRALLAPQSDMVFPTPMGQNLTVAGHQIVKMLLSQAASDSQVLLPMAQAILCTVRGAEGAFQFLELPTHTDMSYPNVRDWVGDAVDAWYTEVERRVLIPKPFKTSAFKESLARIVLTHLPEIFAK